jgi:hypothetical protein
LTKISNERGGGLRKIELLRCFFGDSTLVSFVAQQATNEKPETTILLTPFYLAARMRRDSKPDITITVC